jgi:predicted ATPase/class 3 adenylate cyclase
VAVRELITGTVTFLFSDIEGSTKLLQEAGEGYADLLEEQRRIVRDAIAEHDGIEVGTEGDSFFVVFRSPRNALEAAARIQRSLADHRFSHPLRVRMGVHTGEGRVLGANDYVGIDVHRAARIAGAAHGGQVLVSEATRALAEREVPPGLEFRDLGRHRLKDLAQPEHLHQLVVSGLPSEFPPIRALDVRPNNLPLQLTKFIGREEQVSEVKRHLFDGVRLLTLTGPGGTGKTRLALEVAAEALIHFEDGVCFVDLSSVSDPESVVPAIAEALGVHEAVDRPLRDALEETLRDRTTLLVLDNFEQVVDAGANVDWLLRAAPHTKVIVTSRTVLHRYGEHEFPVPPMPVVEPDQAADLDAAGRSESIRLFVERATAAKPDFALTSENAAAVARIAALLDGLPLAIELAASRVKMLSPQAILDRLAAGSTVLTSRLLDRPERQRSLRGAIEWSYDLLKPHERGLFARMSVFHGGASLEAVESVCTLPQDLDTLEVLESLVDHSLVKQAEAEGGEPRFDMLATIRAYAAERLEEGPDRAEAAKGAHAVYFADLARRQRDRLSGPERDRALAALLADLENLRVAWRYWLGARDLGQVSALLDVLLLLYDAHGWYHATIEISTDLLDLLAATPSTPKRAIQELTVRMGLARALMAVRGYTPEVEQAFESALRLFEGQRDVPQLVPVLRALANFYSFRGDFQKAAVIGEEMLSHAGPDGDPRLRGEGHLVLGYGIALTADMHGGLQHLDEAIACFETEPAPASRTSLGNDPRVASHTVSALVLWLLGFPDRARERADRAVEIAAELGRPFTLAYSTFHSGYLHLWRREPEPARDRAQAVVAVANEFDLHIWRAIGASLLGAANARLGLIDEGVAQIEQGMALYKGISTPPVFWPLLLGLKAGVYRDAGRLTEALEQVDEALGILGTDVVLASDFCLFKGDLLLGLGRPDAEEWFRRAVDAASPLDARMPQLRAATRLCRLRRAAGDPDPDLELRELFETFTEGFSLSDLIDARALLDEDPR